MTKEAIEAIECSRWAVSRGKSCQIERGIVELADDRDRLATELDATRRQAADTVESMSRDIAALRERNARLVALLRTAPTKCDGSDDGDNDPPCWDHRRLAEIGGA